MAERIEIDGAEGEGGGQILRTSLSLSVATGTPVRISNVRGGRKNPGLLRQHLAAVRAVRAISDGHVEGAELGSSEVVLHPGDVRAGTYRFGIGSAGSTTLVLQTVLPALAVADGPSVLTLEGGTHNPFAPTFDFLAHSLAPLLARTGVSLDLDLVRPGFHPAGGGELHVVVTPAGTARPLELLDRGAEGRHVCSIGTAHLDASVAEREWSAFARRLAWKRERLEVVDMSSSVGPGNVISARLAFEHVTEVLTEFGAKGTPGQRLANRLAGRVKRYLTADEPVGEHLADQLMLPLALLAGGRYRTGDLSSHARTNAAVIDRFLPGAVSIDDSGPKGTVVAVASPRSMFAPRQAPG
ncbi:MAG: RNA 3'-terminal phosphate cyclase [Planctomycetota bacterium]